MTINKVINIKSIITIVYTIILMVLFKNFFEFWSIFIPSTIGIIILQWLIESITYKKIGIQAKTPIILLNVLILIVVTSTIGLWMLAFDTYANDLSPLLTMEYYSSNSALLYVMPYYLINVIFIIYLLAKKKTE